MGFIIALLSHVCLNHVNNDIDLRGVENIFCSFFYSATIEWLRPCIDHQNIQTLRTSVYIDSYYLKRMCGRIVDQYYLKNIFLRTPEVGYLK